MKTVVTVLIFFISTLFSFSQSEKINQVDASGKKDGKWLLYLNSFGAKVDSAKSVYCRYTYYDHGFHIQPMGNLISKGGRIEAQKDGQTMIGKAILLDGEYKCLDKKGKVQYIHEFRNGEYMYYKEFNKTGQLQTHFDYTKHCNNQSLSWHMFTFDKTGKIILEQCITKDAKGNWPKMRG